jgi:flagellin
MRTLRADTEFIYSDQTAFNLGGFEVLSEGRDILLCAAGYMVHEANKALDALDEGMSKVFGVRARLGAMQNKIQATINNLGIAKENLSQARSRISDADIAYETSELVRGNILQQAGISILAQANSAPMSALKLL